MTDYSDFSTIHKIKIGGIKYRVRVMAPTEMISDRSFQCWKPWLGPDISSTIWTPSGSQGDLVGSHSDRIYIEVVSTYFRRFEEVPVSSD